jgi:hypothetical protein
MLLDSLRNLCAFAVTILNRKDTKTRLRETLRTGRRNGSAKSEDNFG